MARFTIAGSPEDYLDYLARDYTVGAADAWVNGLVAWVVDTFGDDAHVVNASLDASSAHYYVLLIVEAINCDGEPSALELRFFLPFWAMDLARFYRSRPAPEYGWGRDESVKHLAAYVRRRDGKAS